MDNNYSLTQIEFKDTLEIDEMIRNIRLKKPQTVYTCYALERFKQEKETQPSIRFIQITPKFSEEWKLMSEADKAKYYQLNKEEKERYESEFQIVQNYLIKPFMKEGMGPFRFFEDKFIREAIENGENEEKARYQAQGIWNLMTGEEKKEWKIKAEKTDKWWEEAKSITTLTPFSLFIHRKLTEAKNMEDDYLSYREITKMFSKLSEGDKRKYERLTDLINTEKRRNRSLYELKYRTKPTRPLSAVQFYVVDLKKDISTPRGSFSSTNVKVLWEKLTQAQKGHYQRLAHREKLIYLFKKNEYNLNINQKKKEERKKIDEKLEEELKIQRKKEKEVKDLTGLRMFLIENMDIPVPTGVTYMENCIKKWKKLSDEDKEMYKVHAELNKEKAVKRKKTKKEKRENKENKANKANRVYDIPLRAISDYELYVRDHIRTLDHELPWTVKLEKCGSKWNEISKEEKSKYKSQAKIEKKKYTIAMKEYEDNGYYIKQPEEKEVKSKIKQKITKITKRTKNKHSSINDSLNTNDSSNCNDLIETEVMTKCQ